MTSCVCVCVRVCLSKPYHQHTDIFFFTLIDVGHFATLFGTAALLRRYECKLCHAPNVPTPCCTTCDPVVSPEDMLDMLTECAPTHDFGDVASNVAKLEQTVRQVTWLKFNRLHKYTGLLVGKPRAWLHDTPAAKMIELGMASGATKKLKAIVDSAEHNDIPWPE